MLWYDRELTVAPFKRLVNRQEEKAHGELKSVADDYGYVVYLKVRVADVLPIEDSGITQEQYTYALKAHFDFVACDSDYNPVFVVEFDGPSHQADVQRLRDSMKDGLCKRFDMPILRINTNHLVQKYNKASLLRWIVSAWELQKSFDEAQERGQIPWDEGFDPVMLWHPGKTVEEIHPHWLSLKPRLTIEQLHKQGRLPKASSCQFVFMDDAGNYHGIEWMDVTDKTVLCVETAMRSQLFPIYLGDLFSELLPVLLFEKLEQFLATGQGAVEPHAVEQRVTDWKKRYRFASAHSSGGSLVKVSLSLVSGHFV
jgi:hypothetical protein